MSFDTLASIEPLSGLGAGIKNPGSIATLF